MPQSIEPHLDEIIPSARSKCCSTLEKFRFTQGSVPPSPTIDETTSKPSRNPSRPQLIRSKSSSYLKPTTKRLKKGLLPGNDHLSTADAQWYLRLPQKVQSKHFTEDEQLTLAGHCGSLVVNTIGRATLATPRRPSNFSVPSLRPSSSSTFSSESSLYFEAKQEPTESAIDMDDSMLDELRWMDDQDIDLRLDDYHIHVIQASSGRKSWSSHRRPSYHRDPTSPIPPTSSGTGHASQRQLSPRMVTPIQDTFPASFPSSPKSHHRRETQNFLPIHQNRPSTDSSLVTHHYQDPDARLKLRVWLASASKFDEAVEYGFPSQEDEGNSKETERQSTIFPIQGGRPSLSNRHFKTAPAASQTFFDDSSPSVFNAFDCGEDADDDANEDEDGDTTSLPDLDMPRTPSDAIFTNTHRLPTTSFSSSPFTFPNTKSAISSKTPSLDLPSDLQTSLKPKLRYLAPEDGNAYGSNGNREMTLRMTLTRPDLRDKEDVGRWLERRDPLALEELPRGGLWDEEPKKKGGLKGVWRRAFSGRE